MSKKDVFLLGIILVLAIIIFFKGCGGNNGETKIEYKYKTDTFRVEVPFIPKKDVKDVTPPKTVIEYKNIPVPYEVQIIPDSLKLLIKNLQDSLQSVIIDKSFLTNFPKSSKLINFDLKWDSLNITTLNIQGETKSYKYPMDFDSYKYQWYDNELHHEDFERKLPRDYSKWKQLYLMTGYDFIQKAPIIDINYNIDIKKVRISAGSTMHIATNPYLTGTAKIGFRLFN